MGYEYRMNTASPAQILELIESVRLPEVRGSTPADMAYAEKLHRLATNIEAWDQDALVGIISVYTNDLDGGIAHGSCFCVKEKHRGCGAILVRRVLVYCRSKGFKTIQVADLDENNVRAIALYRKLGGFQISKDGRRLAGQLHLN